MPNVASGARSGSATRCTRSNGGGVRRVDLHRHGPRRLAPAQRRPAARPARLRARRVRRALRRRRDRAELLQHAAHPVEHASGDPQPLQLLRNRRLVGRQVRREARRLAAHDRSEAEDHAEAERHHQQHRRDPRHVEPPERAHQRRQHEGQQHRQHDRDQHLAREVEDRHHDRRALEHLPPGAGHGGGEASASRRGRGQGHGTAFELDGRRARAAGKRTPARPIRCAPVFSGRCRRFPPGRVASPARDLPAADALG